MKQLYLVFFTSLCCTASMPSSPKHLSGSIYFEYSMLFWDCHMVDQIKGQCVEFNDSPEFKANCIHYKGVLHFDRDKAISFSYPAFGHQARKLEKNMLESYTKIDLKKKTSQYFSLIGVVGDPIEAIQAPLHLDKKNEAIANMKTLKAHHFEFGDTTKIWICKGLPKGLSFNRVYDNAPGTVVATSTQDGYHRATKIVYKKPPKQAFDMPEDYLLDLSNRERAGAYGE